MRYIISLATKNYMHYVQRMFQSIRGLGWREEIILFTPDDGVYCNEKVIKIEQQLFSPRYTDCRWVLFELMPHFKDGDKVMFFDADCYLLPSFPLEKMFKYNFILAGKLKTDPDAWPENWKFMPQIIGHEPEYEYVAAPFLWTVDEDTKRFFRMFRLSSLASFHIGGGMNVTLTTTVNVYKKFPDYIFPYDKVVYTLDPNRESKKSGAWMMHYGGRKGKEHWVEDFS